MVRRWRAGITGSLLSLTVVGLALAPEGSPALAQSHLSGAATPAVSLSAANPTGRDVLLVLRQLPTSRLTFIGPSWRVGKALGDVNGVASDVAVSANGRVAVVTMEGYEANELVVFGGVNTRHPHVTARVRLAAFSYPSRAALTPDGTYAYVPGAGTNGDTVGVFSGMNTRHPKLVDSLLLNTPTSINDSIPCGIAISRNGKYAYATDYAFGTLTVIRGVESAHPRLARAVKVGQNACQVWVSPDGKYLYKINPADTRVTVIGDANSRAPRVLDSVRAGPDPGWIAVTPNGKYLYVPSGSSDKVTLLGDAQSAHPKVIRTLTASPYPLMAAVAPDGEYAYISDGSDGRITVFAAAQTGHPRTVNPGIRVPGQGELLAVGPAR